MKRFKATLTPIKLNKRELKKGFKNGVSYEVTVLKFTTTSSAHGFADHWVTFADANGTIYNLRMVDIVINSKEFVAN